MPGLWPSAGGHSTSDNPTIQFVLFFFFSGQCAALDFAMVVRSAFHFHLPQKLLSTTEYCYSFSAQFLNIIKIFLTQTVNK
jgi:hypothetical protein